MYIPLYLCIIIFGSISANTNPPSLFQFNQGTFQAFYFFKNVTIDTLKVSAEDWVGTFNCTMWDKDSTSCKKLGVCVGSRKWDTSKCGSGVCDLPAMGVSGETKEITKGYMDSGEYPVFLIYDKSHDVYYRTEPEGDVQLQNDICRNGYPYCYGWENFNFYFIQSLAGTEIYMDCNGKLGGSETLDDCGICGGSGPQYYCSKNLQSYCSEYEYEQECIQAEPE